MNLLLNLRAWFWINKNTKSYLLGLLILFVITMLCGTTSVVFPVVGLFGYISGILSFLMFSIFLYGHTNANSSKNYKIAILEAKEFREEKNKPDTEMASEIEMKISALIIETELSKDPTALNAWIENFKKLKAKMVEKKELEELRDELPGKIKKVHGEMVEISALLYW